MKKHILATVIGSTLLSASATATTSMVMRIPLKENLSSYSATDPVYHPWMDVGTHYSCESWSPETNTINYGQAFTQNRDCSQDQTRNVDIREYDSFSDSIRIVRADKEDRTISEEESQGAVGTYRDWGVTESTFTEWSDIGVDYDFSSWSPTASSQTEKFSQSRGYSRDQERFEQKRELDAVTGDIRNNGDPIKHEKTDSRSQSRDVAVVATAWSDVGGHYSCEAWSPTPEEVDVYEDFTQTRDCKQNQSRRWSYDSQGSEIHTRMQNRTISETESQNSVGTRRDWIVYDSTFTDWEDTGSAHSYTQWSPAPVDQAASFTQTRNYKQPQERDEQKRQIDTVSGEIRDNGDLITHTQDDPRSDSRAVAVNWTDWKDTMRTGHTAWLPANFTETANFQQTREFGQHQIRDRFYTSEGAELSRKEENRVVSPVYEHRTVDVTKSAWSDTDRDTYSSWYPAPSSQTSDFTQTRSYTQNQKRTWVYKAGTEKLDSRIETRGVADQSESRGVKISWDNWSVAKDDYSCGTWSPATNTKGYDESFTQTRSCKQDEKRTRIYKSGSTTLTSATENRTIDVSQSRAATGIGSWENYSASCGSWASTGNHTFSSWSPSHGSQTSNYSQSRSYKEDQTRTCQPRERDTISGTVRNKGATYTEDRTVNQSQSRTISVSASGWSNTSTSGHTSWSPAESSQTSNFTQTRSYTQNQKRTWTHKSGTTSVYTRDETKGVTGQSESRTVAVSWNSWSVTRNDYSCGSYSPATNTKGYGESYTQTRSCKEDQTRNRYYKVGSSTIKTVAEPRTINVTQSRSATGVGSWESYSASCSSWAYVKNHSHGSWSPSHGGQTSDYSQSRSYKRDETRICQPRERDKISGTIRNKGSSYTDNRTLNKSQSRHIDVSASGWSNTSTSGYSSYSPSAGSQKSNFTQTRTYTQNQKRTWTHKSGSSTVYNRDETRSLTGQKQSRTVTASWSGWSYHKNHRFSGYSPSTGSVCSGSSFTQTETYKRQEKRTISYSIGGTGPREYRDLSRSRSRSATGSKSCWASASSSYSSWSNTGSAFKDCGSYTPSRSSVNLGQSFTQKRTCQQKQERTKYYREYNSGTGQYRTVNTKTEYRHVDVTHTSTKTGTKDYVTNNNYRENHTGYSSWSCDSWSPLEQNVSCGMEFRQTRDCDRVKREYYKRYRIWKSGRKEYLHTKNISITDQDKTESRTRFGTRKRNHYDMCMLN